MKGTTKKIIAGLAIGVGIGYFAKPYLDQLLQGIWPQQPVVRRRPPMARSNSDQWPVQNTSARWQGQPYSTAGAGWAELHGPDNINKSTMYSPQTTYSQAGTNGSIIYVD